MTLMVTNIISLIFQVFWESTFIRWSSAGLGMCFVRTIPWKKKKQYNKWNFRIWFPRLIFVVFIWTL